MNQCTPELIARFPKVELHAHLNGSISYATMKELVALKERREGRPQERLAEHLVSIGDEEGPRSLDDCFAAFGVVHRIVDSAEALHLATTSVVRDFASDQVKYLELRSTPKALDDGTSREGYVECVLRAIDACNKSADLDIQTRFLASIDRKRAEHELVVDLATKYRSWGAGDLVGIDLSGDPSQGCVSDLAPSLRRAASVGLPTSLHLAEVPEPEADTIALLDTGPARLGHGTCLLPEYGGSTKVADRVARDRLPLELCLTSNVKGRTVASYDAHHFGRWWRDLRHPVVVCTDDKGVFATSLSREYGVAARTFGLDAAQVAALAEGAVEHAFASPDTKEWLRQKWLAFRETEAGVLLKE